jgi:hypothetical protein
MARWRRQVRYALKSGPPSIDLELMIGMRVVGSIFAIRSERLISREVQVNLAYRWFCKLGIEDAIPIIRHFRELATSAFGCVPERPSLGQPQRRRRYRAAAKNKTHVPKDSSPRYAKSRRGLSPCRGELELRI